MRRRLVPVTVALLALVAVACHPQVTNVPGGAPKRYRDLVFAHVAKTTDVVYGHAPDRQGKDVALKLDVYQPVGDTRTKRPVVVWVHGGAFRQGSKTSVEIVDEATTFARKGYVNVSIDYRLGGGCFPFTSTCLTSIADAKHDAQAAVRYLRSKATQYEIDPDRIAIAGTSAGAMTALNVAYGSEDVGTSGTPGPSSKVRAAVSLSGAALGSTPSAGEPPALLFHGTADTVVRYDAAVRTVDAARKAGLVVELTAWSGDAHVPYTKHRDEIILQTTNFLYWELDLSHAYPR